MSFANEYRSKYQKEITTPSGFVFQIRALSPLRISRITTEENIDGDKLNEPEYAFKYAGSILIAGVVDPKLTARIEDANEDILSIEELANEDTQFLINEITSLSGLTANVAPLQDQSMEESQE
jgi:hypothetical protein